MTVRRLVIGIAFLGIVYMATRPMLDTDTWWHLRTGQWILDHHAIPGEDPFSYTRAGTPWYYPAWLAEVAMVEVFSVAGATGLNLFFAVWIVAACILIFASMRGDPFLRAFVLVIAASAAAIFWSARPQIFTFLLSAWFFLCLWNFVQGKQNLLWTLPIGMALWVNLHGGFIMGFLLILLMTVKSGIRFLSSRDPRQARKVFGILAAGAGCLLAIGLNPRGWAILAYPFQTISIQFLQQYIQEWQTPNFHYWDAQLFLVLFFIAWAVPAFSPKRLEAGDFFLLAVISYMGFLAGRNTYFLSIVAPALIAEYGRPILETRFPHWAPGNTAPRLQSVVNSVLLIVAALAVGFAAYFHSTPAAIEKNYRREIAVDAVTFLSRHPGWGNLFNSYNWGSYLLWKLPSYPVFVDGRTDLYDEDFLKQYLVLADAQPGWQDVLSRWGIQIILVEPTAPIVPILESQGWSVEYTDAQAVILRRPDAEPSP